LRRPGTHWSLGYLILRRPCPGGDGAGQSGEMHGQPGAARLRSAYVRSLGAGKKPAAFSRTPGRRPRWPGPGGAGIGDGGRHSRLGNRRMGRGGGQGRQLWQRDHGTQPGSATGLRADRIHRAHRAHAVVDDRRRSGHSDSCRLAARGVRVGG